MNEGAKWPPTDAEWQVLPAARVPILCLRRVEIRTGALNYWRPQIKSGAAPFHLHRLPVLDCTLGIPLSKAKVTVHSHVPREK